MCARSIFRKLCFMVLHIILVCLSFTSPAAGVAFLLPNRGIAGRCCIHRGSMPCSRLQTHVSWRPLAPHSALFSLQGGDASQTGDPLSVSGGAGVSEGGFSNGNSEASPRQSGTSQILHVRLLASRMQQMVQFYSGLLGMEVLARFKPGSSEWPVETADPNLPDGLLGNKGDLWSPLNGTVDLADGTSLPVDEVALLGFPHNDPAGNCQCISGESHRCLNNLKIELVHSAAWAERQIAKEEEEKAALRKEESFLMSALAAFQQRYRQREYKKEESRSTFAENGLSADDAPDEKGENSQLDGDGLPSLTRVRAFERKRGKFDRNHHGFFGFTILIPSLKTLELDRVLKCGAKMLHCPARRKELPSLVPDQHAKQELWNRSCFLLDPDGNGVEVVELSHSSSATVGMNMKTKDRNEYAIDLWHSMLADQNVDIDRQKQRQDLEERLIEVQSERAQMAALEKTDVGKGALSSTAETGDAEKLSRLEALKSEEASIMQKLEAFEAQQKVLDELEKRQQALQHQREVETSGSSVTHDGPLTPRLQKRSDPFLLPSVGPMPRSSCCNASILRRFAAMSRSYACEELALQTKQNSRVKAEAASEAVNAAARLAGDSGLYGEVAVPAEWEGLSAEDPGAAAALVYETEAAERRLPQIQIAYAYDEDRVSVHPAFLHLAVGVDSVLHTLENVRFVEQAALKEAEESGGNNAMKDPEFFKKLQAEAKGIAQSNPLQGDPPKPTEVVRQTDNLALVRNFDGYPLLLVEKSEALGYYQALRARAHVSP